MNVPFACPDCGVEGQIQVDFQLGEAVCHSCASVVMMGMLENEQTRFDTETTMRSVDGGSVSGQLGAAAAGVGGARRGGGGAVSVQISTLLRKAATLISRLRERSGCPPKCEEHAAALYERLLQHQARHHQKLSSTSKVQGACFCLATLLHGWPIQPHELEDYDAEELPVADVRRELREAISTLELAREVEKANATLFTDIARVYLMRLGLDVKRFGGIVARLAEQYNGIVGVAHNPVGPSVAVAVSIYLCGKSKKIANTAGLGTPLSMDAQQFLSLICSETKHSKLAITNALGACKAFMDQLAAAVAAPAPASAPASAAAGGERGEEPAGADSAREPQRGVNPSTQPLVGLKRKDRE